MRSDSTSPASTIGVLIPTYRRPDDARRCLLALKEQTRPPDQVILTVRDTDAETQAIFPELREMGLPLDIVMVSEGGVIAAMNKGREISRTDIIAFTDDDSRPLPGWLEKIANCLAERPEVVGVGGRDIQFYGGKIVENWPVATVGQVRWFGRTIGNHHLDFTGTAFVDTLKGVNMAFRNDAIRDLPFDVRLRGAGAQVHFEMMFCLTLRKRGGKLFFDAGIAVNHYPAARHDNDITARGGYDADAFENYCFNETLCLLEFFPAGQDRIYRVWAELVGTRANPGLVQLLRLLPREGARAQEKYRISRRARQNAAVEARRSSHR